MENDDNQVWTYTTSICRVFFSPLSKCHALLLCSVYKLAPDEPSLVQLSAAMPSLMSQKTNVVIFKNWRCVTTLCDNSVWDVDYITYNPPASAIVCHLPPIEDMPCLVPPLLRTYAICIEHPDQALVIISGQSKKS